VEYQHWETLWDELARTHADRRARARTRIMAEMADTVISQPPADGQDPDRCAAPAHVREAVSLLCLIARQGTAGLAGRT
jgi:hypothetical protein